MARNRIAQVALGGSVLVVAGLLWLWRAEPSPQPKDGRAEFSTAPAPANPPRLATPPSLPATPQAASSASIVASAQQSAAVDAHAQRPATHSLSESGLMERLRKARAAGNNPLAIELAREGNKRFPDSELAPERHSILIHALADNGQRQEARGEAEVMVNHYKDSSWVREIERFTGAHRRRNVRLNDAGELEYYDAPGVGR